MANFGRFIRSDRTLNENPEIPGLFFGRVVMDQGNRKNIPDPDNENRDLMHVLTMMELNRKHRQKKQKGGKKREDRLRGLFGGN